MRLGTSLNTSGSILSSKNLFSKILNFRDHEFALFRNEFQFLAERTAVTEQRNTVGNLKSQGRGICLFQSSIPSCNIRQGKSSLAVSTTEREYTVHNIVDVVQQSPLHLK